MQSETLTLADCPIGLFMCGDELCLKTEYGSNEGRIDAYIVSSGEFFWGAQPQSIVNQRAQLVTPVDAAILALRPADQGEGWVCVPRAPTQAIIDAMEAVEHPNNHAAFYCDLYAAALSAAPALDRKGAAS